MLEKWAFVQRGRGNAAAADQADVLRVHYGDVPLPVAESRARGPITGELKEALRREGLTAVYSLTGDTIADQKEKGRNFWYITESDNNSLLTVHSLVGDVAIDPRPNKFFLPKSNNLTLDQQLEMTAEYSYKLQRKLKTDSIEAILGQAPDYSALAFAHLDATTERLFGKNYDYNYTATQTPTSESRFAVVGRFGGDGGLRVDDLHRDGGDVLVWAAPLVVAKPR